MKEISAHSPSSLQGSCVTVSVNDETRTLAAPCSVYALLQLLGMEQRSGLALAINGQVVARDVRAERVLQDGDRVLIFSAAQGG